MEKSHFFGILFHMSQISQIDGLEAGKITYEDHSFLPPTHQFDCFHHRGSSIYGCKKVFACMVVS